MHTPLKSIFHEHFCCLFMESERNRKKDTEPPNWLQSWTDEAVIYMTHAAFPSIGISEKNRGAGLNFEVGWLITLCRRRSGHREFG